MNINLTDKITLPGFPSGSGIVHVGDHYYAIGDDAPYLFKLDAAFAVVEKIPLLEVDTFSGTRISKPDKPDFETLEKIGDTELVVFGSGSKSPQRDVFVRILLEDSITVEKYVTTAFYTALKSLPIFAGSELNLEAVAYRNGQIFLFNRKKNLVLQFPYVEVLAYLQGVGDFPIPMATEFTLPAINGVEAGFSGATALEGQAKIIFTASVEDTDNAYDDGEILGSFLGTIDLFDDALGGELHYIQLPGSAGVVKVESITVTAETSPSSAAVVLITDNDRGDSDLFRGVLSW
ncbi:hypothetical protein QWY85_06210 [Neolewinella lacunae]|uniref:Uncharacterized protein n=1 Tax=Neolewinella lacunae TaxID=1517758 RepID=A0A923PI42_9BACT|nr:hypothetical protein [Neolewinella lacunae]MBC6994553.1 hypothetical protein [Neolewinella lacunae]MDN3634246.1 hypothetical protein [Neolewinella lacunae]